MKTELLGWLIDATLATSLACTAVLLLRRPLQRLLGAEIAYRLWVVLPLAVLAACFRLPQIAPAAGAGAGMQVPVASRPAGVIAHVISTRLGSADADGWLLAAWLIGAGALLAVLVLQQRRFVARLRLRQNGDGSWRSSIAGVVPAVLGVLRQKLVLPEGFETDYNDEEQRLVIAHERMHQRRRDPWALATSALLRILFWFNPIMHIAAGRFRRDVEMACDSAVLRAHRGSRRRYASALLKTHVADGALPIGCQWHQTPPMEERIMLLKHALPTRHARLAGAILLSIAALTTTGIAMAGHDVALDAASVLAATPPPPSVAPAQPAPQAQPVPPTMANVDTPPAPTARPMIANARVPAQPAHAAPPAHARHAAQLAAASAPRVVPVSPAVSAVVPITRAALTTPALAALALAPIVDTAGGMGSDGRYTLDAAYMNAVDRAADDQGVRVIWVNPPEKRKHD
ncbi:MAG TPA: M56 family metallopeptidase [Xanthomonadaceae bacterium]|jgi:beta-lactamase regulating signal transducer with metallopeptidase domain